VSATTDLDFTMPANTDIDSIGIYMQRTGNSGTCTIELYYETAPATYTLLKTISAADGKLTLETFTGVTVSSGNDIKIRFILGTGPFYVRQIMVGKRTTMEQGHYVGVNPPTLSQGFIQTNNLSENGAILGSNVKRIDVKSKLSLNHLTETWVRSTWDPFAIHAAKGRGFFYQWNPTEYSNEVVYCVASKVGTPSNIQPTPLMAVDMDLICRQPDPA